MKRYPKEVRMFIAANVVGRTTKELTALVNKKFGDITTESKMKSYKANHDLKSGTPSGLPKGRATDRYPQEVKDFIQGNFSGNGPTAMAKMLNDRFGTDYTASQMKSYYGNHKLNSGVSGRFKKGHIPANKGKKGLGGWEPTQFRRGHVPKNYRPVGSTRVNVYGYEEVKVADPNIWRPKHHVVWEEHNGSRPEGTVIIFADRDKTNFNPDNLVCITNAQLAVLNKHGLIKEDSDLTKTGIVIANTMSQISAASKRLKAKQAVLH